MRAGTVIAIIAVALIALGAWYFVDVDTFGTATAPDVDVSAEGGDLPETDVETGDIEVDPDGNTVEVPDVDVTPAPAD